jgi:hypothetical protein
MLKNATKTPLQPTLTLWILRSSNMLNPRKRHGWSTSYNESGDALNLCWNSKASSSSSATNRANIIADDQTIGTTVSSRTILRCNLSFQNMQPSKKPSPVAAGAAVALPYTSIRHFVVEQTKARMLPLMLSNPTTLINIVRMSVQGTQDADRLTDEEIIHRVEEAYKNLKSKDSGSLKLASFGGHTKKQVRDRTRAAPVNAASDEGESMILGSVESIAASIPDAHTDAGAASVWNSFLPIPPATTGAALAAGLNEIALAPRSGSPSDFSSLTGDRSMGLVVHGVEQLRSSDDDDDDPDGNYAMNQASHLNGAGLLLVPPFPPQHGPSRPADGFARVGGGSMSVEPYDLVELDTAEMLLQLTHAAPVDVPDGVAPVDGGSMFLESVSSSAVSSSGTSSAGSGSASIPYEIALASARSDSLTGDRSIGLVAHGVEQRRSADDDDDDDDGNEY